MCSRAKALEHEFSQLGLKAATQNYTLNTSTDSKVNREQNIWWRLLISVYDVELTIILKSLIKRGVNTYAVFYAPRSDGTEALVLSASWTSRDTTSTYF
jgi:glycosylphosphatidylinositol transamidase